MDRVSDRIRDIYIYINETCSNKRVHIFSVVPSEGVDGMILLFYNLCLSNIVDHMNIYIYIYMLKLDLFIIF